MAANTYDVGDIVRLAGSFTDTGGDPLDPSKVTIEYEDPTGAVTALSTGQIVHPSTGYYYGDVIIPNTPGVWEYRIYSTGTGQTADESWFRVRHKRVST